LENDIKAEDKNSTINEDMIEESNNSLGINENKEKNQESVEKIDKKVIDDTLEESEDMKGMENQEVETQEIINQKVAPENKIEDIQDYKITQEETKETENMDIF
jgi:hypothetical protein